VSPPAPAAEDEGAADEGAADEGAADEGTDAPDATTVGRKPAGGGTTDDDPAGRGPGGEVTAAVPRTARFGPIKRAARLKTLRVAVS
jgi:hypothetical protein